MRILIRKNRICYIHQIGQKFGDRPAPALVSAETIDMCHWVWQ